MEAQQIVIALLAVVLGVGSYWFSRRHWQATGSTAVLAAIAIAVTVFSVGGAWVGGRLPGEFWGLVAFGFLGLGGAYWLSGDAEPGVKLRNTLAATLGLLVIALVTGSSGTGNAAGADLLGSFADQVWTNFFAVAVLALVVGYMALTRTGEGRAVAVFIGAAVVLNSALLFQGSARDRLMAMFYSAAFAIVASGVLFVAANKWFDLALDRWKIFGAVSGAVVGAMVWLVAWANRLLQWRIGSGEAATDLTVWLLFVALAVGAVYGMVLSGSTTRRVRLIVGVGGGVVIGLIFASFLKPEFHPAIRSTPLVIWPLVLAAVGALLALVPNKTLRASVFGFVVLAGVRFFQGDADIPFEGYLGLTILGVLFALLVSDSLWRGLTFGAAIGWLLATFLIPSLGSGSIAETIMALSILGGLIGARLAFNRDATKRRVEKLTLSARTTIFLVPALSFIGATLVIPTIRTMYLSFLDSRGEAFVGWQNYATIFTDKGIVNVEAWPEIFTNVWFRWTIVALVISLLSGLLTGRSRGQTFASTGLSYGGLAAAIFLLAFAVFSRLRGTVFNNLWWVFTVTIVATGAGLAIAVLADRAKGESFAKSLIFMPMAVSFVGAGIIWRFMYIPRDFRKEQTGVLNSIWVGLGRLSQSETPRMIAIAVLVAVVLALLALALVMFRSRERGAAGGFAVVAIPVALIAWRLASRALGGFEIREDGSLIDAPIQFLSQGPFNNVALMIVLIWIQTGFAMVILSAAIKGVPADLIEAAKVDGATEAQSFWRITIPQIAPTIGVVITTLIVTVMKVFDIVKVMTNGNFDTQVLANEMFQRAIIEFNLGLGSALAILLFLSVVPVMYINIRRTNAAVS